MNIADKTKLIIGIILIIVSAILLAGATIAASTYYESLDTHRQNLELRDRAQRLGMDTGELDKKISEDEQLLRDKDILMSVCFPTGSILMVLGIFLVVKWQRESRSLGAWVIPQRMLVQPTHGPSHQPQQANPSTDQYPTQPPPPISQQPPQIYVYQPPAPQYVVYEKPVKKPRTPRPWVRGRPFRDIQTPITISIVLIILSIVAFLSPWHIENYSIDHGEGNYKYEMYLMNEYYENTHSDNSQSYRESRGPDIQYYICGILILGCLCIMIIGIIGLVLILYNRIKKMFAILIYFSIFILALIAALLPVIYAFGPPGSGGQFFINEPGRTAFPAIGWYLTLFICVISCMEMVVIHNLPDVEKMKKQDEKRKAVVHDDESSPPDDSLPAPIEGDEAPGEAEEEEGPSAFSICPYCGKELKLPKPPVYCPYCKEKLTSK